MQYRSARQIQRLPVGQRYRVHGPLSGSDIVNIRIIGIGNIGFDRIYKNVCCLIYIIIKNNGVLPRFRDRKAYMSVSHRRNDAAAGRKYCRALDRNAEPRCLDIDIGSAFKIKISKRRIRRNRIRVPDMFMIDHYVIDKKPVSVYGYKHVLRTGHGLRAFVQLEHRLSLSVIIIGSHARCPR